MEVALGCFEEDNVLLNDDLSKPPTSGIEYLKRVQLEAKRYPDVVMADYPKSNFVHDTEVINTSEEHCLNLSKLPPEKCQSRIASDFACLRQMLVHYKSQKIPSVTHLPPEKDRDQWQLFCFGQKDSSSENHTNGHPPLLSIIQDINQPLAMVLLQRHLDYFKNTGFSVQQGKWFYALLLCLDRPTPPDVMSVLREFARHCCVFTNTLSSEDELLSHLTLFIVIVTKYFGQNDLTSAYLSSRT